MQFGQLERREFITILGGSVMCAERRPSGVAVQSRYRPLCRRLLAYLGAGTTARSLGEVGTNSVHSKPICVADKPSFKAIFLEAGAMNFILLWRDYEGL
jgi:hypothetical protein